MALHPTGLLASALLLAVLSACGGGGSGSGSGAVPPVPPPPSPSPTAEQLNDASRMAARATMGMNRQGIQDIAERGLANWLEAQFDIAPGYHQPIVTDLLQRQAAGEFTELEREFGDIEFAFRRMAFWQQAINAPDVLRQRLAFALSEIFVVSDHVDVLQVFPYALSNYYDTLLEHAFGNYRDLLRAVTLHPAMGIYLSHINNAKADPEKNTFPDENYAREAMQLFSIGLFELNPDGSEKLDAQGQPVPTYDNDDIREFAKVYTGLSFAGPNATFGGREPDFRQPMEMFDAFHDMSEKHLLRDAILPAGQTGMADIDGAIDNLFNHPNVGPFIGRQLIQRLVTSNPSPAYIARVSAAFNGDDTGVRGDMKAVLRAVLLDPEALDPPGTHEHFGKLREPLMRATALLRQFNVTSPDGFYANLGYFLEQLLLQHPLSAPSVFSFFLPAHSPVGPIANAGLVAPEFEITNSTTIVNITNLPDIVLLADLVNDVTTAPFMAAALNLDNYLALADDTAALVDRLDLVMTYGTLSSATRAAIIDAVSPIDDAELKVKAAMSLLFMSPDYAVRL